MASDFNTHFCIGLIEVFKTLFLMKYKGAEKDIVCWSIHGTTLSWFFLDSCLLSLKTVVIGSAGRSTATAMINPSRSFRAASSALDSQIGGHRLGVNSFLNNFDHK